MNIQEIKNGHQQVCQTLAEKRIKESLDTLGLFVKETHHSDLIDNHYNLEFTYKSLLKYMVEGASDPERQKVYNHLLRDIYLLTDRIFDHLLTRYAYGPFYETKRELQSTNLAEIFTTYIDLFSNLELKKLANPDATFTQEDQQQIFKLYNVIWTNTEENQDLTDKLTLLFDGERAPWYHKSLFVSAIILSLLQSFNLSYIILLLNLVKHPNDQVKIRALTGLLLLLYKYDDRLTFHPEIASRVKLLTEDAGLTTLIQAITLQLIRTRETEKISKKMTDEILPEVVKIHPRIKDKLDLENMISEKFMEDKNPEWEDFFKDTPGLVDKLEELTQWQMEGADVFLTTFKMLKHFPFFNHLPNWLSPFYLDNPDVLKALQFEKEFFNNPELLEGLADSRFLCNSDKFSLILSIPHMPTFQKEMMGQMFSAELQQMTDIEKDEKALDANQAKLVISNQFIQDLYRLLKVHPQKHHFEDVFSWPLLFHKKWFYKQCLPDDASLREIAEYYFKKNYFDDALNIFKELSAKHETEHGLMQKVAYCYQHLNDYESALAYYLKADLFANNSNWNKKKIALCYRHLKNPAKALEYYKEAERIMPDNLHTQASIGHCLLEMKDYTDALKYYFKVEYLDQKNTKVWRPIAWCSFVLGKFDQAEKYYHKLLISEKNKHDLLNMGHVCWCKGNRIEALSFYQKSIQASETSKEEFFNAFNDDTVYLIKHGVDKNDIPIMKDQIRYALES
ncbi:hypothetical protein DMA11_10135 [Marinilabiliaceae bacterium JC017]|nr:hypothetical protein DMA11_10135 [Marinilabiliaceae bacterium JC017]